MIKHKIVTIEKATARVIEIGADLAFSWLTAGEAILVDVREHEELEIEWIPGAVAMPLSRFNPNDIEVNSVKKIMLICHTGRRSKEAAERLLALGFFEVYNVKDGLLAWNAAGFESIDQSALLI